MPLISQSQTRSWLTCEKKWQFKYKHHIVSRKPTRAQQYGSLMHECLADHYSGKNALKKLRKKAKNHIGDHETEVLYAIIETNFIEYLHYWRDVDMEYEVKEIEGYFEVPLPGKLKKWKFRGYYDAIFQDHSGEWLVEHKTGKQDLGPSARIWDLQSSLYHWAWRQLHPDRPLRGTLWNYVTSSALQPPKILKDGSPSRAQGQRTTERMYYQAILDSGRKPEEYDDMLSHFRSRTQDAFRRLALPVDRSLEAAMLKDLCASVDEIKEAKNEDGYHFKRNLGRHCGWCDYEPLCHLELTTGEWEDATYPDFKVEKKRRRS